MPRRPEAVPSGGLPRSLPQGEHSYEAWLPENLEDAATGLGDRVRALLEDKLVEWEELSERVDAIDWEVLLGPQQFETYEQRREAPGIGA